MRLRLIKTKMVMIYLEDAEGKIMRHKDVTLSSAAYFPPKCVTTSTKHKADMSFIDMRRPDSELFS